MPLDIRQFGAVGDGTTECAGALADALVALARAEPGAVLDVPDGHFVCDAPVSGLAVPPHRVLRLLPGAKLTDRRTRPPPLAFLTLRPGATILGAGPELSTIELRNRSIAINLEDHSTLRNIALRGDGGRTGTSVSGINSGSATAETAVRDVVIAGCRVEQWREHGINTGGWSDGWRIEQNEVRDCTGDGILLGAGTQRCLVRGNRFRRLGGQAVDINGSRNHVTDNDLEQCGIANHGYDWWGILVQSLAEPTPIPADGNVIIGNRIRATRGAGIAVRSDRHALATCRGTVIRGNVLVACGRESGSEGISLDAGQAARGGTLGIIEGTVIEHNLIREAGGHAIRLYAEWEGTRIALTVIHGNTCMQNVGAAIVSEVSSAAEVRGTVITDNLLLLNGGGGLQLSPLGREELIAGNRQLP